MAIDDLELRDRYKDACLSGYDPFIDDEDLEHTENLEHTEDLAYTLEYFAGIEAFFGKAASEDRPIIFTVDQ